MTTQDTNLKRLGWCDTCWYIDGNTLSGMVHTNLWGTTRDQDFTAQLDDAESLALWCDDMRNAIDNLCRDMRQFTVDAYYSDIPGMSG